MIHSISNRSRVETPWAPVGRWLEWLGQGAAALRDWLRFRPSGPPELRLSREWLDDHRRWSRGHPDPR